jgi:hypothetical protein
MGATVASKSAAIRRAKDSNCCRRGAIGKKLAGWQNNVLVENEDWHLARRVYYRLRTSSSTRLGWA